MFRNQSKLLLSVFFLALVACDEAKPGDGTPPPEQPPDVKPPDPTLEQVTASQKANLKFKGGERYARDLSVALDLPREEVCLELGSFDCVKDAHRIVLGGVAPYRLSILEPLPEQPLTAPIAVDRVALSACQTRSDKDFDNPGEAKIYGALIEAGQDPSAEVRSGVVTELYDRFLLRPPEEGEVEALVDLFDEVDEGLSSDRARDWATLTCFSIATTLEALFY